MTDNRMRPRLSNLAGLLVLTFCGLACLEFKSQAKPVTLRAQNQQDRVSFRGPDNLPRPASFLMGDDAVKDIESTNYSAALAKCDKALQLFKEEYPNATEQPVYIMKSIAFCLIEMGHYHEGLDILLPLLRSGYGTYWYEYAGLALAHVGRNKEALEMLKSVPSKGPGNVGDAWNNIGEDSNSLEMLARHRLNSLTLGFNLYKAAMRHVMEEKKLGPRHPLVALDMGITYFSLRRYSEAEKEFELAAKAKNSTIQKSTAYWLERVHYQQKILELDNAAGNIRKYGPIYP